MAYLSFYAGQREIAIFSLWGGWRTDGSEIYIFGNERTNVRVRIMDYKSLFHQLKYRI